MSALANSIPAILSLLLLLLLLLRILLHFVLLPRKHPYLARDDHRRGHSGPHRLDDPAQSLGVVHQKGAVGPGPCTLGTPLRAADVTWNMEREGERGGERERGGDEFILVYRACAADTKKRALHTLHTISLSFSLSRSLP
jgi:hypothetical protein